MGYAETVERLMGVEIPERAEYLRVIWHELSRIHSHILWMGLAADAFGFESLFMHCWRLRERVLDIFEKTTGGRVIFSVVKVGGVVRDIDAPQLPSHQATYSRASRTNTGQICNAFLKDTLGQEPHGGRRLHQPAGRRRSVHGRAVRPRLATSTTTCAASATARYGDLADFQPILRRAGRLLRPRARCALLEVLQSIDIIEEMIAKIPAGDIDVPVKGVARSRRARPPTWSSSRAANATTTRAATAPSTSSACACARPPPRTSAGMTMALAGCDLADVNMIVLTIDPCISCTER